MSRIVSPESSRLKLFVSFAALILIGLWVLVHFSLREYRNFEFSRLERESTQWLKGIALQHSALVLAGEEEQLRLVALDLLRRPELVFVRFDSPGSKTALVMSRNESLSGSQSALAGEFDRSFSRIVRSEGSFVLQVVVPIQSVLPKVGGIEERQAGASRLGLGSISVGRDVTMSHAALEDLADRIRLAQAMIAAAILLGIWVVLRRADVAYPELADSAEISGATPLPRGEVASHYSNIRDERRRASASSLVESATPSAPILPFERAHRILVVEDNPVNRSVAVDMLEQLGCSVSCAENGETSVAAVDAESFDLVFMDIQMPGMDGLEATRRIRGEEKRLGSTPVPIVALTAHSQPSDRIASARAGMNDHISKPFSLEDLAKAIRNGCEAKGDR